MTALPRGVPLLVEVPVRAVAIDEARFPDPEPDLIYDHVVRCCARLDPLEPISIAVDEGGSVVVKGHQVLRAARALGRATIRAAVVPPYPGLDGLLRHPDVRLLGVKLESADPAPVGWHVFFFERPLTREEKEAFDAQVVDLFGEVDPDVRVWHDDGGPVAEIEARTPVADHFWKAKHLQIFAKFSRERVRIVSFQGRRVPF